MEHEERIRILLSMQEHPELYSDKQIQQMLDDDLELAELLEQVAWTKQAFVKQEGMKRSFPWKRNGENSVQVTLKNWTL